jgi:hypothetical protein
VARPRKDTDTASDICRLAFAARENVTLALARLAHTNTDTRAKLELQLAREKLEAIHDKGRLIVEREDDRERKKGATK